MGSIRHTVRTVRCLLSAAVLGALLVLGAACASSGAGDGATSVVYLARHGETVGSGAARHLSEAGERRAAALADRLAAAGVIRVYSTGFPRTRQTAAPLARRLGARVEIYDPRDLEGLARRLVDGRGTVLVVGHSNTTPELVALLGGEPGEPIAHDEHDRLYRVELPSGETAVSRY